MAVQFVVNYDLSSTASLFTGSNCTGGSISFSLPDGQSSITVGSPSWGDNVGASILVPLGYEFEGWEHPPNFSGGGSKPTWKGQRNSDGTTKCQSLGGFANELSYIRYYLDANAKW